MPRIMIAGTGSGVGKTTVALSLIAAFKKLKSNIQPFKVGPDYIDTAYHSKISNNICRNLDSYLLSKDSLLEIFIRKANDADLSIIEGVMGYYDGCLSDKNMGSSYHVAKITKTPVILVLDIGKMSHSAGALSLGFLKFKKQSNIKAFILNRAGSESHYKVAKKEIEEKCKIPVVGYLPKNLNIALKERHLGLKASSEVDLRKIKKELAGLADKYIDLKKIKEIANVIEPPSLKKQVLFSKNNKKDAIKIGIAKDECFHFYYQDNLELLENLGAEIINFSPLNSKKLPYDLSGIYIGGGFPELFAEQLKKNKTLLRDIKQKSIEGIPIYAECGGLMYLMKEIEVDHVKHPMVDIFDGVVKMGQRLQHFGYHDIESNLDTILAKKGSKNKGHLFHWSYIENGQINPNAFILEKRGKKIMDGYVYKNTLASYVHLHFASNMKFVEKYISSCKNYKKGKSCKISKEF